MSALRAPTRVVKSEEAVFPTWTTYVASGPSGGMYPLGLEAVGQNMIGSHVLPGVTDATVHPRYFSFFAWTFDTFERRFAKRGSAAELATDQHRFRARLENALRSCTLAEGSESRGIIGSRGAFRFENYLSSAPIHFPRKLPSGIDPANYGASFVRLGLGYKSEGRMHTAGLGLELAAAFEESLTGGMSRNERKALELLLQLGRKIPVRVYEVLQDRFRVRPISPAEPEHAHIVDALFRLGRLHEREEPSLTNSCRARAHGLCLLLALIEQGDESIRGPEDFYGVFSTGRLATGRAVELDDPALATTLEVWRRYMERQWQKTALNAFWHETLNILEDADPRPVPAHAIVARIQRLTSGSRTLRKYLGPNALARSARECLSAIGARLPRDRGDVGVTALELANRIRQPATTGEERLGQAVVLLFVSAADWQRERERCPSALRQLHMHGGPSRLTLPWMVEQIELRGEASVTAIIEWVVEWCILSQSMRVAYEKIDQGNRFFIHRVDGGYCLAQDRRDANGYFSFDSSRLGGAYSLLRRLGLIRADGRVTSTGRRIKNAAIERWRA